MESMTPHSVIIGVESMSPHSKNKIGENGVWTFQEKIGNSLSGARMLHLT